MSFSYHRTINFRDTDAAKVVYFSNTLSFCHEAYEAFLMESGYNLKQFFSNTEFAIPIVHASIDFVNPIYCGDRIEIQLCADVLKPYLFELHYQLLLCDPGADETEQLGLKPVGSAITRHVCICPDNRKKRSLPEDLLLQLHTLNS